jgi:cellulose synthase operon protein C
MTRSRSLQISLYGVLLLLAGASPPSTMPLEVEYAGCEAVLLSGPVCGLKESRELRLWVKTPSEAQIEIRAAGKRLHAAGEPVQDGQYFALNVPAGATRVHVLAETSDGAAAWSLALEPQVRQARQEMFRNLMKEIGQVASSLDEHLQNRRLAAARKMLDGLELPPEAPAEFRCVEAYFRGVLADKEGDHRSALASMQEAVEIANRVGLKEFHRQAQEALALLFLGVGRSSESAELFELLAWTADEKNPCNKARLLNNQAWSELLAREAGESFGDPTPTFEKAFATYEACEYFTPSRKLNLLINLALAHLQEGRLARAKDFLAQTRKLEDHATLLLTLWWLDLEARIALLDGSTAEALRLFEHLEELAAGTSSPDGRLRAAVGQARAHMALGDRTTALEVLRRAEALLDEQSLQISIHEGRETFMATRQAIVSLHVELLLKQSEEEDALTVARQSRSRMLRQLERSDRLASLTPARRAEWDRLLKGYQQKRAALEERTKDDWRLPLDQLRREQAARAAEAGELNRLLDQAFLILGPPGEQPGAVLSPPSPGELILAYHPLLHGWVGFATDGKTVAVHPFDLPPGELNPSEELSRHLLLPFGAQIKRAERLRILASGRLQEVDFNALPFDGDILLAKHPLVYGLDLPVPPGSAQTPGRRALLVADPRDNLPKAFGEVQGVQKALESRVRPWATEMLKTAEASLEAVLDRLATVDLFHYAGHGKFSGFGGWESSLLLAEKTRLTLGDLLALERVPAWVVLSACESGRSSTETPVESLGLAHAFLLAGSQGVIASTEPAKDIEMPQFFADLYRQWDHDSDLAVALQEAQLSWRKRNPKANWQSFRLFVP